MASFFAIYGLHGWPLGAGSAAAVVIFINKNWKSIILCLYFQAY